MLPLATLTAAPAVREIRARLTLNSAAEAKIRRNFPWIFADDIAKIKGNPKSGDLVVIYNAKNKFFALALWDGASTIQARLISRENVRIDANFFADRLAARFEQRCQTLKIDSNNNAFRVSNGENDGLPGLIVDIFNLCAVIKCYNDFWLPELKALSDIILKYGAERVVFRSGRACETFYAQHNLPSPSLLRGDNAAESELFSENGAVFRAHVAKGQKTGFFIDQRDNRRHIRQMAGGKRVLDLFCYSGAFGVNAALGGAESVLFVDSDPHALELVREHLRLNRIRCATRTLKADVFDLLRQNAGLGAFDLIIVDPPNLTSAQAHVDKALSVYTRLAKAAYAALARGGIMLCCSCSSRVSPEAFKQAVLAGLHGSYSVEKEHGLPADHPATFREARYLKALTVKKYD